MNEQLAVYLWSISEQIQVFLVVFSVIGGVIFTFLFYVKFDDSDITGVNRNKSWIPLLFLFMLLFAQLIPCKKDLALILAIPTIKSTVNSQQVQKLNKASNLYLDNLIKELEKSK